MNTHIFTFNNAKNTSPVIGWVVFLIGVSWFASIIAIALSGGFEADIGKKPIAILLAVTMPVIIFGTSYLNIKGFRNWILALDMRQLILLHSWRMVGVGFIFLYFHDKLPALFALPAGIGDAIAAISALFLGIALYQNASTVPQKRVYVWNTFGLLDFIIAVSMGVTTRTNEILYFTDQASSDIMGVFPLVLIPCFIVPFYIITHIIIYIQVGNIWRKQTEVH